MAHPDSTQSTAGRSGLGALVVGAFVWLVFDNLALGIIAGLLAGGGMAAQSLGGGAQRTQSPDDEAQK